MKTSRRKWFRSIVLAPVAAALGVKLHAEASGKVSPDVSDIFRPIPPTSEALENYWRRRYLQRSSELRWAEMYSQTGPQRCKPVYFIYSPYVPMASGHGSWYYRDHDGKLCEGSYEKAVCFSLEKKYGHLVQEALQYYTATFNEYIQTARQ